MNKKIFSGALFIVGVLCFLTFNIIGSEVLSDGTLHEPFFLIPIGYLFVLLSIIIFVIDWFETK